jgi:zinc/manganese transport system permease protein
VRALGIAFVVLLALTVTMAVQVVGTLLLFALVVTPAATALRLTARPARVAAIAVAVALLSVWAGLVLSAVVDLPPSFFVVAVAVLLWLGARVLPGSGSGRIAVRTQSPEGDHAAHPRVP